MFKRKKPRLCSRGFVFALPIFTTRGSDASAAGGGYSELSEWQRSVDEEGACRQRRYRAPQQEIYRPAAASVQWTLAGSC
jgi:hypothetical protein